MAPLPTFMNIGAPFSSCLNLVEDDVVLEIITPPDPYEHWVINVELDIDGYFIRYHWNHTGGDQTVYSTRFTRVPHPCDERRMHDAFWQPITWKTISGHRKRHADPYVPRLLAEPVISVLRTDSFYRLR